MTLSPVGEGSKRMIDLGVGGARFLVGVESTCGVESISGVWCEYGDLIFCQRRAGAPDNPTMYNT